MTNTNAHYTDTADDLANATYSEESSHETLYYSDLHRHLDGSIRLSTMYELASLLNINIPQNLFFYDGMGIVEALSRFSFTLSLLQKKEDVRRVASEICEDAINDNVKTLEIRFAPQLHLGSKLEEIIDYTIEGVNKRAGIILCGLYGENPKILEKLIDIAKNRKEITGIDLAGAPRPDHSWKIEDYSNSFIKAKKYGLGTTIHAGEGRDPLEIAQIINKLKPDRIGHGTTLFQNIEIARLIKNSNITIEACISSNVHVGAISSIFEHQLSHWLDFGIKCCICTDNTLLSATTSKKEHEKALQLPNMTKEKLATAINYGHLAVFKRD